MREGGYSAGGVYFSFENGWIAGVSLLKFTRPKPEIVFTPRKPLNEKMYAERRLLETKFERAIRGSQHIAVFGDSGNGKTWLYQKVLKDRKCPYILVDLSVAKTSGLDNAFRNSLDSPYGWEPSSKSDDLSGGIALGVGANRTKGTQYTFADKPPFEKLMDEMSKKGTRQKFIVFDNLESVVDNPEIIEQLTAYILRLDNPKFVASGVRFLFVGVVSNIRALLSGGANAGTISNRIFELPEVKRLSPFEAETVLRTGLLDLLKVDFGDEEDIVIQSCKYYSGRSAQHIHEIGLNIGFVAEDHDWEIGWLEVADAILDWSLSSLQGHAAAVRARLNKKETRVQRRNQVLYVIAKHANDYFSVGEIDAAIRKEFPDNTQVAQLGIDQILKGLAQGKMPILERDSTTNRFRFSHPKLRIAIRHVLHRDDEGGVTENTDLAKVDFS